MSRPPSVTASAPGKPYAGEHHLGIVEVAAARVPGFGAPYGWAMVPQTATNGLATPSMVLLAVGYNGGAAVEDVGEIRQISSR